MSKRNANIGAWILLILVAAAFTAGGAYLAMMLSPARVAMPTTAPTTRPATLPTTVPAARPRPAEYIDVVRLRYPDFPTTQPLMVPVTVAEAARIVIDDPMYLDPLGELWITRSDAESTAVALKAATQRSTHVVREDVVFVYRMPDEHGVWQPQLVCPKSDGRYEIVTATSRQDIDGAYDWDWPRAFQWNEVIVAPSSGGISIIRPNRRPMVLHHQFTEAGGQVSPVQALLDWRGLIAWMPWENAAGSRGAARFVNDQWVTLDASAGWPEKILHLVPLLDGSMLQLFVNDSGGVDLAVVVLDPAELDEAKIGQFVEQLSDPRGEKRAAAFNELTRWGPGIWPVLEKLMPDQPPEAQLRIEQLLASKTQPTLGGMALQGPNVKVIARGDFGGAMLYSDGGVAIPRDDDQVPTVVSPAWLSIQPGRAIELVPPELGEQLKVEGRTLRIVRGEFIVSDDAEGPRWWLSNHLSPPLLKRDELAYRHLVGQDARGRWLFRKNAADDSPTLVIDPTLPDPTPRLPVWVYHVEGGQVGWTADDWPAIKRGGAWALVGNDWKPIKEPGEKFLNESATLAPTTAAAEQPILVEGDGTRYFGGGESLRVQRPDGTEVIWPLLPNAVGSGGVHLLRAGEDRLFLYNQAGRLLRIQPTPNAADPFKVEAVFTNRIPNVDLPARVWRDPAGRIVFAYNGDTLAICFPAGRIPPEVAKKLTAQELRDAEQ